ncbi:MAG: DUF72 domain-containing protein [Armatimonadetes bacterium]|nr:DUF72 domain-containing protein [Armatimonadota bacterium]
MARVYVGTSGYSYEDWVGKFYPVDISSSEYLTYYAQVFDTVEINYTYYRMPNARTMRAMARKVADDFTFSVKAHSTMTHTREATEADFAAFREALTPLEEEGKLAAVLAQYPWSFKPGEENVQWLYSFRRWMGAVPTVVEFRNRAWITEETFALLEELELGFCCVDEPRLRGLMPPIARATSDVGYVRFHGRNADKWWQHDESWQRYDYLYTRQELGEWVPKVRALSERASVVYVYFNNHYQAQAVKNASLFRDLLAEAGIA